MRIPTPNMMLGYLDTENVEQGMSAGSVSNLGVPVGIYGIATEYWKSNLIIDQVNRLLRLGCL